MILMARRRWVMGGTRYHARGVDEKGNVANCAETEMIIIRHKSNKNYTTDEQLPYSMSTIYSYC